MFNNALKELIQVCSENNKQLGDIEYGWVGTHNDGEVCVFDSNSIDTMKKFLEDNFSSYDSGYGTQILYGEIVFKDKTWLERGEYDGAERREYKACPKKKIINKY